MTKIYEKNRDEILKNKLLSDAARTYMINNLEMSYFFAIKGYKGTISYAPMISGKKGVKRADMTVGENYYDDILDTREIDLWSSEPDKILILSVLQPKISKVSLNRNLSGRISYGRNL